MNISADTIAALKSEYIVLFYNSNLDQVQPSEATEICVCTTADGSGWIGKHIKALKKEITMDYIMDKLCADKVYVNFCKYFNGLVKGTGINAYPTSYGIGTFVAFGLRTDIQKTKDNIADMLNGLGVKYQTEYSEANWVFRYKISKEKSNIELIKSLC